MKFLNNQKIMATSNQQLRLNLNLAINKIKPIIISKEFLFGNHEENRDEEYIQDKEKAVYYATSQDAQDDEPGIKYWTNILEYNNNLLNSTDIKINLPDGGKEIVEHIESATSEIMREISKRVAFLSLPSEFTDVISEDFYVFINELTFFKELHPLQQRLFDVYKNGGFPCGWRGDFPDGQLLVFCCGPSGEQKVIL